MKEKLFPLGQIVRVTHFNNSEPQLGEVTGYAEQTQAREVIYLVEIRLEDGVTVRVEREDLIKPV